MTYLQLALFHLATIVPAFLIGTFLLLNHKGTRWHKILGKTYMSLMMVTAIITLFMEAKVGLTLFDHFGFIHIFSALVLYLVPSAFFAARRHDVSSHRYSMIGLYVGGIIIAGIFTFMPGRMLHEWFFT